MTSSGQIEPVDDNLRITIVQAIRRAQAIIKWKPGKAVQHLTKRISLGHLPARATLIEYETIITTILNDDEAEVYIFLYGNTPYPTIAAPIRGKVWLVMMGLDGVMETAFPPDETENYLADVAFVYVGTLKELQNA